MNEVNCELATGLVSQNYIRQGRQGIVRHEKFIKDVLSRRKLPEEGWQESTIMKFIDDCALMDSNNFSGNVGVGEREARIVCPLVARRYYNLGHGIGRSGDVAAEQPKAAGSSLISKLAVCLVKDALSLAGLKELGSVTLLPFATGMAMTLALLTVKAARSDEAKYVLWPRIDQKTCLKCIVSANLVPLVIENVLKGDELRTDMEKIKEEIERVGGDSIVCVLSTTSCFAPRGADRIEDIARLCRQLNLPHVINNAYGVQSTELCARITRSLRVGRVDCIVQSTDKNFMVPVGGSVLASPILPDKQESIVDKVNKTYPGRAAVNSHLDVLMTLLHLGVVGWKSILQQREDVYVYMKSQLVQLASKWGQRVLETPNNPISIALGLGAIGDAQNEGISNKEGKGVTFLGSMLWARWVSGCRVVDDSKKAKVGGIEFLCYGSHYDSYPYSYLTAAAALGTTQKDVDEFVNRLEKCMGEFKGIKKSFVSDKL